MGIKLCWRKNLAQERWIFKITVSSPKIRWLLSREDTFILKIQCSQSLTFCLHYTFVIFNYHIQFWCKEFKTAMDREILLSFHKFTHIIKLCFCTWAKNGIFTQFALWVALKDTSGSRSKSLYFTSCHTQMVV